MFLVEDKHLGATNLVFTWKDPRKDGFQGNVTEGVTLDYDMEAVHSWPDGDARPEAVVGRAKHDSRAYKVFRYAAGLEAAGYDPIPGTAVVFGTWADYLKVRRPEDLLEEDWFNVLDQYDEAARRRRQRPEPPDLPPNSTRDDVAAWVAKQHFIVDTGVREVWYLPQNSPPDEIRLLELKDRYPFNESQVQALNYGSNVGGLPFRLMVAEVSTDQLAQVADGTSRLPNGWSLEGNQVWRRRRS